MAEAEGTTAAPTESVPPSSQPHIKIKKLRQRACNEKDAKGKVCCGHLKRWYEYPKEVEALVGPGAEIYRCENCKMLYCPDPAELPRSYTHRY